jgi:hypothetical protein
MNVHLYGIRDLTQSHPLSGRSQTPARAFFVFCDTIREIHCGILELAVKRHACSDGQ